MHFTCTSLASAIDNVICIWNKPSYELFVQIKIPCEVGTVILQTANSRVQKQTTEKSFITQALCYEDGRCWCCTFIHICNTLPVSSTCINHSMQILLNTYLFLYVTATNILKVYFHFLSINEVHLQSVLHLYFSSLSINEVYFNCTFFLGSTYY